LPVWRRGKVRDVYDLGETLLLVASDRLSAYDHVLRPAIPGKGKILTQLSNFWFEKLSEVVPNHLLETDVDRFPPAAKRHADLLRGRSVLVRKTAVVPFECVARGYLAGSAFREYRSGGLVCGVELPAGLDRASRLPEPVFTPATKAESGHDENVSFDRAAELVGAEVAAALRARSLAIYEEARAFAWERGLVLADTKFEFGFVDGRLTLIDEVLSPDSSRYWDRAEFEAGRLLAYDKQYVRDWLDRSGWNHEPPAPALPDDVVRMTSERYRAALTRLTGAAA